MVELDGNDGDALAVCGSFGAGSFASASPKVAPTALAAATTGGVVVELLTTAASSETCRVAAGMGALVALATALKTTNRA